MEEVTAEGDSSLGGIFSTSWSILHKLFGELVGISVWGSVNRE